MFTCVDCGLFTEKGSHYYALGDMVGSWRCNECGKKLKEERERQWRLKECPLEDNEGNMCILLDDNEDRNVLYEHLLNVHSKEQLAEFITSGVETNWD